MITLTAGIPEWFIDQFKDTIYHVCQQKESLFAKGVRVEPLLGAEDKAFDQMGTLELVEKAGYNPDTPSTDPTTGRRWVDTTPYHNAFLYDRDYDLDLQNKPTSDVAVAFRRAVNRKKDDIILAAMDATVYSGRRKGSTITWASQLGTTAYAENSGGRTIPYNCSEGNCSASDTGMTVEKVELILEYFNKNEVEEDTPIFCAISPRQATNLFGQEEYVNIDYQESKPLTRGRILKNWHGINWIISNKIVKGTANNIAVATDSQNIYKCWAWAMDGIILGVQSDVTLEIDKRSDKSNAQQIYIYMNMGAFRMDEDRVCLVECK